MPDDILERMVILRREIHGRPELAWSQSDTVKRVCERVAPAGRWSARPEAKRSARALLLL